MIRGRALAAATVLAALALITPASAAGGRPSQVGHQAATPRATGPTDPLINGPFKAWEIYQRVHRAKPGALIITIRWGDDDEYSAFWLFGVAHYWYGIDVAEGNWGLFGQGASAYEPASVYGTPAGSTPSCASTCSKPIMLYDDAPSLVVETPHPTQRFFLISTHTTPTVSLSNKDWAMRAVNRPVVHRVLGRESRATGAVLAGLTVEHFTSATAPGGRYGSIAFTSLPCEQSGTGQAVFSGGLDEPARQRCGINSGPSGSRSSITDRATTWKLVGDVTGASVWLTRLFVFDFPRRL